jgi:hypothetical protein
MPYARQLISKLQMILTLPPLLTIVLTRLVVNIFALAALMSASSAAGSASTLNYSRQRTLFPAVWDSSNIVNFLNTFAELLVADLV